MPVVRSLDPHRGENACQRVDLAQKSCAANRPSPSCSGSVFDVAAIRHPARDQLDSSREISVVLPGSSSSNSSMQTTV
jgi:hypothetical protein